MRKPLSRFRTHEETWYCIISQGFSLQPITQDISKVFMIGHITVKRTKNSRRKKSQANIEDFETFGVQSLFLVAQGTVCVYVMKHQLFIYNILTSRKTQSHLRRCLLEPSGYMTILHHRNQDTKTESRYKLSFRIFSIQN